MLSPTDLTRHQECHHLTALNLAVADGTLTQPTDGPSDQTRLVADLGTAHELRYLESLEAQGLSVARLERWRGEDATADAMRAGVDVIHQATLSDGTWSGQADFLLKTPTPSDLGDWSYEVADAMSSVVEYEQWLADRDPARLQAIESYNKDDVDSTRELHD